MTKKKDNKLLVARFLQERSNLIHENLKLRLRIEALEKKLTLTDVSGCYSIEQLQKAVNFWAMTHVDRKYIKDYLNNH